jgi:signal transduction histidine kinase
MRIGPVRWTDLLLTAFLLFLGLGGTAPASSHQHTTAPPGAYVLVVIAALAVVVWRHHPLWTFVISGGATMLYIGLGYAYGPILFAAATADLTLALRIGLRRSLLAMGALLVASVAAIGVGVAQGTRVWTEVISLAAWLIIPAAVGMVIKARRDATSTVREEQARRAVTEERLRLAQEVHDVAGHGFAVIAMQAGVALRVLDRDPGAARSALEGIRAASREALDSLRSEIEALQQGTGPLRPGSGLADLPALAGRIRTSGLPVSLDGPVAADDLPPDVDRTAYRIVQESLTNVLRHAGADATAAVAIRREPEAPGLEVLCIEVRDTGRGSSATVVPGRGLAGMRSRAEALGGTVEAGPGADGGFTVIARLPWGSAA